MQLRTGTKKFDITEGSPINYRVQNSVPNQATLTCTVMVVHDFMNALMGVYAQDSGRQAADAELGIRYDYFNAFVPAQHLTRARSSGARLRQVECVPCWKDINPRFGVAYDLFGNGKTAVKFSVGRSWPPTSTRCADPTTRWSRAILTATRTWTDNNDNYMPDCDLANSAPERRVRGEGPTRIRQDHRDEPLRADVLGGNRPTTGRPRWRSSRRCTRASP